MGVLVNWLSQWGGIGNFIVIDGPPHTGKTTVLMNLFKACLDNGFEVITTSYFYNMPPGVHYITKASELLRAYTDCNGLIVIAIDDAQARFDSTSMANTLESKYNMGLYSLMAKFQSDLVFVAHFNNRIPSPLLACKPMIVYTPKPKKMEVMDPIKKTVRRFKVPPSPYKFPKATIPAWRWDINPLALYERLSQVKGSSESEIIDKNKAVIRGFLDNVEEGRSTLKTRDKVEIMLDLCNEDMGQKVQITQKWIAEKIGVTPAYISKIKKSRANNN